MLTLDLDSLPKVYPERYENNYFEPGTYTVKVGDGFGKGDFLIKFVDMDGKDYWNRGVVFEVFKREKDGNYYHDSVNEKRISFGGYNQLLDIVIEVSSKTSEVQPDETVLIYHPNCTVFFNYCTDEKSPHYAYGQRFMCDWRCPFEANADEIKKSEGMFTVVFSEGYEDLAEFELNGLQQCYADVLDFLRYDPQRPRIGLKVLLADEVGSTTGKDEYITAQATKELLDQQLRLLNRFFQENSEKSCLSNFSLSHELTHVLTNKIGSTLLIGEGLAEFVRTYSAGERKVICFDRNYFEPYKREILDYRGENVNVYEAGYCFWEDIVQTYGYPTFVKVMQKMYEKSRGIDDYYMLDVFDQVVGESFSQEILDRYMLNKEGTFVEVCKNCKMFL